jgi:hypothetical protein
MSEYDKQYYLNHSEYIKKRTKEYDLAHPEATVERHKRSHVNSRKKLVNEFLAGNHTRLKHKMWISAKDRAKRDDVPFTILEDDIVIPEYCPIFKNLKLCPSGNYSGVAELNSPSLDRIVPDLGYVLGNIWVISNKANTMKNGASKGDLKEFAYAIYNLSQLN